MATANASGSASLLVDYYNSRDFILNKTMRSSTLKALIIHTADDKWNTGPDYQYGWGVMDVNEAATDYIKADWEDFMGLSDPAKPQGRRIIEGVLTQGTTNTYTFTFDSNSTNTEIWGTLCWTDPPAVPIVRADFNDFNDVNGVTIFDVNDGVLDNNSPRLVNDLDMRIYKVVDINDPNQDIEYLPWVLDPNNPMLPAEVNDNTLDNVEQVYIDDPNVDMLYRVVISHKSDANLINGLQHYSLILSEPIPFLYIWVDDDGPYDPYPGIPDPSAQGPLSDPNEDGSREHPFDAIQKGIDIVNSGEMAVIIVMDGTYSGIGNYNIDPGGKSVIIMSHHKREDSIIDCQWEGRGFYIHSGETTTTILDGLTIKNGYAENSIWPLDPCDPPGPNNPSGFGGGVICTENSRPWINDCFITTNEADFGGAGVYCDKTSNALILVSEVYKNYCESYIYDENQFQVGGGIYCEDASPVIAYSAVGENEVWGWWKKGAGGGIASKNSNMVVLGSLIYDNWCTARYGFWNDDLPLLDPADSQHGGGIYCEGGSPIVYNCFVEDNRANYSGGGIASFISDMWIAGCAIVGNNCWASAGGVFSIGTPFADFNDFNDPNFAEIPNCWLQNCLIAKNWGAWVSGVGSDYGSYAIVENCTITDNPTNWPDDTGGLRCKYGQAEIVNTIIWNNSGIPISGIRDMMDVNGVNFVTISYSDIQMLDANWIVDINEDNVWVGIGNMNKDPLFARNDRDWYHLQTEYPNGRFNPATGLFEFTDDETSPCIDAGDPSYLYNFEPQPNGGRINMGTYGNTWQASMSPGGVGRSYNMFDFAILADSWRLSGEDIKDPYADLNSDGIIDEKDLLEMSRYWLK